MGAATKEEGETQIKAFELNEQGKQNQTSYSFSSSKLLSTV
jgi:hypothetical protein